MVFYLFLIITFNINFYSFECKNDPKTDLELWDLYKIQHSKKIIDSKRFKIFVTKHGQIKKHNAEYEQGIHSYKKKIYKFHDLTQDEITKKIMGLKMPESFKQLIMIKSAEEGSAGGKSRKIRMIQNMLMYLLPPVVDFRVMLPPVKDQGYCGSCWAFSTVTLIEAVSFKRFGKVVDLSEQHLIDCSVNNQGCDGGWVPTALMEWQLNSTGLTENKFYPYKEEKQSTCGVSVQNQTFYKFGNRYPPDPMEYIFGSGGESYLQQLVVTYGAVSVAVNACDEWQDYGGGIFNSTACNTGCIHVNHAVTVVGYETIAPVPYWLVRNSWGTDWGENGYIKMAMGDNLANIACFAVTVVP